MCVCVFSTLSQVLHAVAALLYPFVWQHTFISIVPTVLIDVCAAPTPYLLGVQKNMLELLTDHSDVSLNLIIINDRCVFMEHESLIMLMVLGLCFSGDDC